MISLTNVSLRQAREDRGLSPNGGLANVQEFIDCHRGNGYTLFDLRGHVACFSKKVGTGSYSYNWNTGADSRPNWAEANSYSVDGKHTMTLSKVAEYIYKARGGNYTGNDALGGWSFVGTIPPGTANYKFSFAWDVKITASRGFVELIGWPSGYFVGTPNYYLSWSGSSSQTLQELEMDMDGTNFPYVTLNVQTLGGTYVSEIDVKGAYVRRK